MTSRDGGLKIVAAVVGFVLGLVLVFTLMATNDLLQEQNEQGEEADVDRLRSEYQRVLLGCNTAGAVESEDAHLRRLCDEELDRLLGELEEAGG